VQLVAPDIKAASPGIMGSSMPDDAMMLQNLDAADTVHSDSTRRTYRQQLRRCLEITRCPNLASMLRAPKASIAALRKHYPSDATYAKALTAVSSLLRANPGRRSDKAEVWRAALRDIAESNKEASKTNVLTDEMRARWTTFDEISDLASRRAASSDAHSDEAASQLTVLLSMFAHVPPKRADYGSLHIVADEVALGERKNGMVVPTAKTKACRLVLDSYKTRKVYGRFVEDMPPPVCTEIRESLRRYPRAYLLTGRAGEPLSNDAFSKRVRSTFERLIGVPVGVNSLRHMWITQRINPSSQTIAEMEAVAASMMHHRDMQAFYRLVKQA
jgi:hypothetical protein